MSVSRWQDTPCNVVISNSFDTSGTITRASVNHLTPSQLDSLFKPGGNFADMKAWFQTQFEMKACGTKINGMYDWLMSSQRNMGNLLATQAVDRGPSLLFPFILARQDSVVNVDIFWAIITGQAVSAYTGGVTGPLTTAQLALAQTADRVIRVVNRYGVDTNNEWFLSRDSVYIFSRSGGQTQQGQWKVIASAADAALTYIDVIVVNQNNGSPTPYATAPTSGIVVAGGNNVNDYESWCNNRPTIDPRKRVPFWYQTMRRARSVDSQYKEVFARLMESNDFFINFGDLPLSERNRQDEEIYQRRWVNTFMWGKKISGNQTLANWQNLEQIQTGTGQIVDPGLGGKAVAYRANEIGVFEQLVACDRWRDLQNNPLNFYEFLDENYRILRARKSQGRTVDTIDWFTDQVFAANFETAFIQYLKKEYGDIVRLEIQTGSNELGFHWKIFKPKFPAVSIAIVTHEFFDDRVNAFANESIDSAGRLLLCLDMGKPGPKGGTIYPGMITSNKKMRTLGDLNTLGTIDKNFACTMEYVTQEISLTSETTTAIVECPANSCWISGIQDTVPNTLGRSGTQGTPSYYDLY